jgi:signal transduction histidine kinase
MTIGQQVSIDHIATPVFILHLDSSGKLVYKSLNKPACSMVCRDEDEYLGRAAFDVYPGSLGRLAYEKQSAVLDSGVAETYEVHLPANGRIVHVRSHLYPVKDDVTGDIIKIIGTSENISAEHNLRESRSQSVMFMRDLERFINIAAHDLRSPMLKINALTDVLQEGFEDLGDGKAQALEMLDHIAANSLGLIEEILSRARIVGAPESVENFKLSAVCDDVLRLLDPTGQLNVSVEDAELFGDRVATHIALRNLIDNSTKHNRDDAITMRVFASSSSNGFFSVTVGDDGVGVDNPALLFNADAVRDRVSSFGLQGVQELIKFRGGTIFAEKPANGRGVAITFTLPGEIVDIGTRQIA